MSRPSRDRTVREPIGIGEALRDAREARGLTLAQVAKETRIRAPFLLALEEEDFADLPAPIYARAFLRTYADHIGLDVEALVALLDEHHRLDSDAGLEPATRVVSSDSGFSRLLVPAGFGAFVLGAAYFLFAQYSAFVASQEIVPLSLPTSVPAVARQASSAETKPIVVPTATQVPASATPTHAPVTPTTVATVVSTRSPVPTAVGAAGTARPSVVPPTATPATKTPAATPSARPSAQASAQPTQNPPPSTPTAPPQTPTPAQPTPPGTPTAVPPTATPSGQPATVEARFSGDCWIVAEVDDKVVQNGVTQKAGDRISWTGRKFVIKFGNAGVVDLSLSGKPATRLGATGEVVNWNWNAP